MSLRWNNQKAAAPSTRVYTSITRKACNVLGWEAETPLDVSTLKKAAADIQRLTF